MIPLDDPFNQKRLCSYHNISFNFPVAEQIMIHELSYSAANLIIPSKVSLWGPKLLLDFHMKLGLSDCAWLWSFHGLERLAVLSSWGWRSWPGNKFINDKAVTLLAWWLILVGQSLEKGCQPICLLEVEFFKWQQN